MNEKHFKPHGLYALIMTYKPGSKDPSSLVDIDTKVTSSVADHEGRRSKFHASAGKTYGDLQMPEAASPVFPHLEKASDEQKQNTSKRAYNFAGDYGDRRAQAEFVCFPS